jgi:hypothetical protein
MSSLSAGIQLNGGYGTAKHDRAERDAPESIVSCQYLHLVLEEVGHTWVREAGDVLGRVREGTHPEELGKLGVNR